MESESWENQSSLNMAKIVMLSLICLFYFITNVTSMDVVCGPTRTKLKVKVGNGDSFSFKTQEGDEYGPGVRCIVSYKKKRSCPAMRFSCSEFDIHNKNSACTRGDRLMVDGGRYCQNEGPDVVYDSNSAMRVVFRTNNRGHAPGAMCTIECFEPSTAAPVTGQQLVEDCACGATKDDRIVGGNETEINKYPWMVALSNKGGGQFCGGSLLASKFVLTAAHCLERKRAEGIVAVIGEHDLYSSGETELETRFHDVAKIILHEAYDFPANDIALVVLEEEVDITIYNTICPPLPGAKFDGEDALVTGWGALEYDTGNYPDTLQEVYLPVQTDDVCLDHVSEAEDGGIICAGGELGKDSCQGDSGGPLSVDSGAGFVQIGVVSGGIGCGNGVNIGFYAEVSYYLDWLHQKMIYNGDIKVCTVDLEVAKKNKN